MLMNESFYGAIVLSALAYSVQANVNVGFGFSGFAAARNPLGRFIHVNLASMSPGISSAFHMFGIRSGPSY